VRRELRTRILLPHAEGHVPRRLGLPGRQALWLRSTEPELDLCRVPALRAGSWAMTSYAGAPCPSHADAATQPTFTRSAHQIGARHDCTGRRYALVHKLLIDRRRALRETRVEADNLRLLPLLLLCLLSPAAACSSAGGRAGTAGMGAADAGGPGVDPYGRCDAGPAGAVSNSPECPVPSSTCNAWWCSPRCPANVGTGDDCPLPISGTAERVCNFSLCYLSCRGGLVCPDGMVCLGGSDCRWPAP
jgi:hypothetical protein